MKLKKGFSLVEVVVAIVLVVIMTALTFSIVQSSRNILLRGEIEILAANEAENIIKARDVNDNALESYINAQKNDGETSVSLNESGENKYLYLTSNFKYVSDSSLSYYTVEYVVTNNVVTSLKIYKTSDHTNIIYNFEFGNYETTGGT